MEVNTQDFREQIAVYLQLVKTGETITLVEDDEPVARIIPIKQTLESQINVLQEAGLVAWNGEKLPPYIPVAVASGSKTVAELLLESRD
jgi:antitoxin (DNA-binding transcriptional repressor) of toxin-antitoxin stability system